MSCCGGKRQQFPVNAKGSQRAMHRMRRNVVPQKASSKVFEYTGRTGLIVRGPITGRIYRFPRHNTRVSVDGRDSLGLTAVPNLRRVSEDSS